MITADKRFALSCMPPVAISCLNMDSLLFRSEIRMNAFSLGPRVLCDGEGHFWLTLSSFRGPGTILGLSDASFAVRPSSKFR